MNLKTLTLSATLAALLAAGPAAAVDPSHNGALATPANRIVGLWSTVGSVAPCGSGLPPSTVRNTLLFSAGGTVNENARIPPQGLVDGAGVPLANQRDNGFGTWEYEPLTGAHSLHLRFNWYLNGTYNGYSTVDRELRLSADGMQVTGAVVSTRYAANGTQISAVCGTAVSDRI
jgi:hypothetical protein